MREKLLRLAKFNQKWFGALLLFLIYFVGLGPAAIAHRLVRIFTRKQGAGWVKTAKPTLSLADLEEQS
jgi:hypothetical protein